MIYEREPRSVAGVLDAGVRLYRAGFRRAVVTAARGYGVVLAAEVIAELFLGVSSMSAQAPGATGMEAAVDPVVLFFLLPLTALVGLLTTAAVIHHLHCIASEEAGAVHGVWRTALRRAPAYLGAALLYGLPVAFAGVVAAVLVGTLATGAVVLAGIVLLVVLVPVVWASVALAPMFYLVFTERLGPIAALRRSVVLVRGNWWRTATVTLVAFLVLTVIQAGIVTLPAFLVGVMAGVSGESVGSVWVIALNLANALAQTLSVPLLAAMGLAIVRDLEIRASGEDLEARLEAAGS